MPTDSDAALTTGPADLRDQRRLEALEETIQRGLATFIEVGEALTEVREPRLYRLSYPSFEAYCQGRWNMSDRRARQLMSAVETIKALPAGTAVPTNEAQARELGATLRDHGPEVAADVMAEASADGPATAAAIHNATVMRGEPAAPDPQSMAPAEFTGFLLAFEAVEALDDGVEALLTTITQAHWKRLRTAARKAAKVCRRVEDDPAAQQKLLEWTGKVPSSGHGGA